MLKVKELIIYIFIFMLISVITIYSSITVNHEVLAYLKQIMWYGISFILIFFLTKIKNNFFIKYIWFFYLLGNVLLLLLLFFAPTINNAKCWFKLPVIGSFQPSEFMKIILLILVAKMCSNFNKEKKKTTLKQEFIFLIKILIITLIPSILTFLEPDTGAIIIYLIIVLTILFISGIRYRWFIFGIGSFATLIVFTLSLYFFKQDMFINIFGNSMFLRIDRLLNWGDGFQLERGITAIGSASLIGYGINHTPLYFPEAHTDFIFAVFASNFGFIGSLLLILFILYFDIKLLLLAKHTKKTINKYIIAGALGILTFQQFQNIGMTLGILPIMGITLPFISYGGSSLLSYMIIIALIINIINENNHYKNI